MSHHLVNARTATVVLFRLTGGVLVVGGIHFAVTSSLSHQMLDGHVDHAMDRIVRASFLLNHLVVGVLLVPLGLSTALVGPGLVRGDRVARTIGWANTLAVLSLPVVIGAVMGRSEILSGGPFTVATGLVLLAALALAVGMLLTRPTQ